MALAATTIHMVGPGVDTNGALFDPSQTAGMFTDLAATSGTTSAPVVTSASYVFVTADEGHWLYIPLGTNWLWGWYQIVSTSGGAATLNGTLGAAYLKDEGGVSTAQGCASTGSPTGGTWTIDYSWNASARFAYTDLASAGTGLTISSAAKPFGAQMVGNGLQTTGGTNVNLGVFVIASVAAGVATLVGPGNVTTGAGVNGTGNQGGCFATPGMSWSIYIAGNIIFAKYNATPFSISASANVAGGKWSMTQTPVPRYTQVVGWDTTRTTSNTDANRTIFQCGAASVTIIATTSPGGGILCHNIEFDGNSQTSSTAFTRASGGANCFFSRCRVRRMAGVAINASNVLFQLRDCYFDANASTNVLIGGFDIARCDFASNTSTSAWIKQTATAGLYISRCNFWGIASSSVDYVDPGAAAASQFRIDNCNFYGNGASSRHGVNSTSTTTVLNGTIENCVFENFGSGGTGYAITGAALYTGIFVKNCAFRANSAGNVNSAFIPVGKVTGSIALSGEPFTSPSTGDFSTNATAGAGAALRAAGVPGTYPAGVTPAGSLDIGSWQHADPAAGGGLLTHPGMRGGMRG